MFLLSILLWSAFASADDSVFWQIRSAKGDLYWVHGTESRKVPPDCARLLGKGGDPGPFKPVLLLTGSEHDAENLELWKRVRIEQRLRFSGGDFGKADEQNLPFIKKIFYEGRFPLLSTRGRTAARHAWILVQHADGDVDFQREVLTYLLAQHGRGDAVPSDVAFLTDRVWVGISKKYGSEPAQLFGTQFFQNAQGAWEPYRIVDSKRVDERRRAYGLVGTLADAIKEINSRD